MITPSGLRLLPHAAAFFFLWIEGKMHIWFIEVPVRKTPKCYEPRRAMPDSVRLLEPRQAMPDSVRRAMPDSCKSLPPICLVTNLLVPDLTL